MTDRIKEAIKDLFENAPDTEEARDLQEEMISNAEEKYKDLIGRGFSDEQAYSMVMTSIGDIQELLADLKVQDAEGEDTAEEEDTRADWEKNADYFWEQAENIDKQAREIGRQAKEAIKSFIGSELWDNLAGSVKQIIGSVGASMQTDWGDKSNLDTYNQRSFATSGIQGISVELQNSAVEFEVEFADVDEILVEEKYNKETTPEQMLEYSISGDYLKLQYNSVVLGIARRGKVTMVLPHSMEGQLREFRVLTASGDVHINSLAAEKINVKTMSGEIYAGSLIGDVSFNTASGDVTCKSVIGNCQVQTASGDSEIGYVCGTLKAKSASGDIEVDGLEGDGIFRAASGDIEVVLKKAGLRLEADTASGDVEIDLPDDVAVQMTLNTCSGDIETFCDHYSGPEHVEYVKHGKCVVGTVGEEPFLKLRVNTASGDIEVTR